MFFLVLCSIVWEIVLKFFVIYYVNVMGSTRSGNCKIDINHLVFFSTLIQTLMSHLLWWSYLNFVQCHLLKQVQIETRLIQTWNWDITIMEYYCCAWMVSSLSFLLLHPTCLTSTFAKWKKQAIVEKPKKAMMFLTSAKIFELCNFCGEKCSKVIMEKLIVWSALYVWLWRERMLFWVQNYLCFKMMQERQKLFGTCHIWARRKKSFMWTKNATRQN